MLNVRALDELSLPSAAGWAATAELRPKVERSNGAFLSSSRCLASCCTLGCGSRLASASEQETGWVEPADLCLTGIRTQHHPHLHHHNSKARIQPSPAVRPEGLSHQVFRAAWSVTTCRELASPPPLSRSALPGNCGPVIIILTRKMPQSLPAAGVLGRRVPTPYPTLYFADIDINDVLGCNVGLITFLSLIHI